VSAPVGPPLSNLGLRTVKRSAASQCLLACADVAPDRCCSLVPGFRLGTTMTYMERIGVRLLQQNAAAVLRRVEAGERVEVTDRGRPVALLVPIPKGGGLDRLRAEGRVTLARRDVLPEIVPSVPGEPALSEILAGMREDER
jgi:prevent-host-death family protein